MNIRLLDLLLDAEARLAPLDQERLAALVEAFVVTHEGQTDFSFEELAHLSRVETEPFQAADSREIERLFARPG